jgi:hypothetical protein
MTFVGQKEFFLDARSGIAQHYQQLFLLRTVTTSTTVYVENANGEKNE